MKALLAKYLPGALTAFQGIAGFFGWLLMNLRMALVIAGIAFAGGALAGWNVHSWKADSEKLGQAEKAIDDYKGQEKGIMAPSKKAEKKYADLERNYHRLQRLWDYESKKAAYSCPVPADGMRLYNVVVSGAAPAASEPNR